MQVQPMRKRTAQVLGLVVVLIGCVPTGWGLSVLIGPISYNFGRSDPPVPFRVLVLGSVPMGALIIYAGKRLASWGLPPIGPR
jgi:hypothetical protein